MKIAFTSCASPSPVQKRVKVEKSQKHVRGEGSTTIPTELFGKSTHDDYVVCVLLSPVQQIHTQRSPIKVTMTTSTGLASTVPATSRSNTVVLCVDKNSHLSLKWNRDDNDKSCSTSSRKMKRNMSIGRPFGNDFQKSFWTWQQGTYFFVKKINITSILCKFLFQSKYMILS